MFMLMKVAMADAYGAGFEFADFDVLSENKFEKYLYHSLEGVAPGSYSDDTQMSIAMAKVILDKDAPTALDFATSFFTTFKNDPRITYAGRFYKFLTTSTSGEQFLRDIKPESKRSGAAMRSGPVGLFSSIDKVLYLSDLHARITHNTPEGVATAQAVATAVHYNAFVKRFNPNISFFEYLDKMVPGFDWSTQWTGNVSVDGIPCVRAALTAYARNNSYSALLKDCVDFTGDTDTVCAIAAAIASVDENYVMDAPPWLIDGLENGPTGRPLLESLDNRLLAHYNSEFSDYKNKHAVGAKQ